MTNSSQLLVFSGVTVMAACACGAGAGLASIGGQTGLPAAPGIYYATLVSIGAALFLAGIRSVASARGCRRCWARDCWPRHASCATISFIRPGISLDFSSIWRPPFY